MVNINSNNSNRSNKDNNQHNNHGKDDIIHVAKAAVRKSI
jgi:hypothetical protein